MSVGGIVAPQPIDLPYITRARNYLMKWSGGVKPVWGSVHIAINCSCSYKPAWTIYCTWGRVSQAANITASRARGVVAKHV